MLIVHLYEFGAFQLDVISHVLRYHNEVVPLRPKAIDTLLILVQNSGRVVGKDELMKALWPNEIVEENNLAQHIHSLRKALGQDAVAKDYIKTYPKQGYRFSVPVREIKKEDLVNFTAGVRQTLIEVDDLLAEPLSHVADDGDEKDGNEPTTGNHHDGHLASEVFSPRPAPALERIRRYFGNHKEWSITVICAVVLSILFIGIGVFNLVPEDKFSLALSIARLTTTGRAVAGTISPDGKLAAYIEEERGQRSLWLKQIATASSKQVLGPLHDHVEDLSFSPDGNYIYFISPARNGVRMLRRIPTFGGEVADVIEDVESKIALSPDGRRLAFIRRSPASNKRVLMIANSDGTGENALAERTLPDSFTNGGPVWSPDGKVIACIAGNFAASIQMNVVAVNVSDGGQRMITRRSLSAITSLCWLPGGGGLLLTATDQWGRLFRQVWHLSYADGVVRRVTNDLNDYGQLSISNDGHTLLAVQSALTTSIWAETGSNSETGEALKLISGKFEGYYGLSLHPAGKIVFATLDSNDEDIWIMDADGGNRRQLTRESRINMHPDACADGKHIVFVSDRSGAPHIWVMDSDGGNQRQLTDGPNELYPSCADGGKGVVYSGYENGKRALWKIPLEGGSPSRLTKAGAEARMPDVSPDGGRVAFYYRETGSNPAWSLGVISIDGGAVKQYSLPPGLGPSRGSLHWTADGRGLAYVDDSDGSSNVWRISLEGGKPQRLTNYAGDQIFSYDFAPDGKNIVSARGTDQSDLVLINNFH